MANIKNRLFAVDLIIDAPNTVSQILDKFNKFRNIAITSILREEDIPLEFPSNHSTDIDKAKAIHTWIKEKKPKSPLVNMGGLFVKSGRMGNINPALIVAIASAESQLGTDKDGISFILAKNPFGRLGETFDSWEDSVKEQGPYMRRKYWNKSFPPKTIAELGAGLKDGKIVKRYAYSHPSSNPRWLPNVQTALIDIAKRSPKLFLNSGANI